MLWHSLEGYTDKLEFGAECIFLPLKSLLKFVYIKLLIYVEKCASIGRMKKKELKELLAAIEWLLSSDELDTIELNLMINEEPITQDQAKYMYKLLSRLYRIFHSIDESHSCYYVHGDWRKEAQELVDDYRNYHKELESSKSQECSAT